MAPKSATIFWCSPGSYTPSITVLDASYATSTFCSLLLQELEREVGAFWALERRRTLLKSLANQRYVWIRKSESLSEIIRKHCLNWGQNDPGEIEAAANRAGTKRGPCGTRTNMCVYPLELHYCNAACISPGDYTKFSEKLSRPMYEGAYTGEFWGKVDLCLMGASTIWFLCDFEGFRKTGLIKNIIC